MSLGESRGESTGDIISPKHVCSSIKTSGELKIHCTRGFESLLSSRRLLFFGVSILLLPRE